MHDNTNKRDRITIEKIAKSCGVSRSTVSRVLTGSNNVKDETRNKVMNVIESLGYRPSRIAQGLVRGKINIIGLIIGDIRNPFYAEMVRGIEDVVFEAGYVIVLCNSDYNSKREDMYIKTAEELSYAGLIMMSAMENDDLTKILKRVDFPVVLINRYIPDIDIDVVSFDNFNAGYMIAEYLVKQGHRNIKILAGPKNSTASKDRLNGYRKALSDYGIDISEKDICYGNLKLEDGYDFGKWLLSLGERPSAVIAGNDLMAEGIMKIFMESGLNIPDDLSIVGFDDIYISSLNHPGLTTIQQPLREMGVTAGNIMLERIKNKSNVAKRIIFNPKIIIRESVKKII